MISSFFFCVWILIIWMFFILGVTNTNDHRTSSGVVGGQDLSVRGLDQELEGADLSIGGAGRWLGRWGPSVARWPLAQLVTGNWVAVGVADEGWIGGRWFSERGVEGRAVTCGDFFFCSPDCFFLFSFFCCWIDLEKNFFFQYLKRKKSC